jgi:hypothetical protein
MGKPFQPAKRVTPSEKLEQRERKNQEKNRTLVRKQVRESQDIFGLNYLSNGI